MYNSFNHLFIFLGYTFWVPNIGICWFFTIFLTSGQGPFFFLGINFFDIQIFFKKQFPTKEFFAKFTFLKNPKFPKTSFIFLKKEEGQKFQEKNKMQVLMIENIWISFHFKFLI